MENQHRRIFGYRELTQEEIDLMNAIKAAGPVLDELVKKVREHVGKQYAPTFKNGRDAETDRLDAAEPKRWASIAATDFQKGLMALTRAVAQPTFF